MMTGVLAVISLGAFLYFPARLHRQIVESVKQKAAALPETAAFGVADGLRARNQVAVAAALTGIRSNPDLVYLVLVDDRGQTFASFNELIAGNYADRQMAPVPRPRQALQAGQRMPAPSGREVVGGLSADGLIYQTMVPVR